MEFTTLADHPELADAAFGIPYAASDGTFMQGNLAAALVRRARLARRWPEYQVVGLEKGRPIVRAVSVPFSTQRDGRVRYPDGGWDQVAIWAAEDAMDGVSVDTVCALEIAVRPGLRGKGYSRAALAALRENARRLGFTSLVAPVRPPGKSAVPFVPIDTYVLQRRHDGLAEDWWLRVHERAGGVIAGIARCSGTVQADLEQWRAWTGLPFDADGEVAVPGGLVPVQVSVARNVGVYVEPNVWYDHLGGLAVVGR